MGARLGECQCAAARRHRGERLCLCGENPFNLCNPWLRKFSTLSCLSSISWLKTPRPRGQFCIRVYLRLFAVQISFPFPKHLSFLAREIFGGRNFRRVFTEQLHEPFWLTLEQLLHLFVRKLQPLEAQFFHD